MLVIQRLRTEFHLALVTLFGAITVLSVTPFAIFRFLNGETLAGVVDLFIVACIGLITVYAWRSGHIERAALMVAATNSIGCVILASLVGLPGVLWMYPALLANFLLISRGRAVLVSATAVIALAVGDAVLVTTLHKATFMTSAFVTSLFAYIFASRTELQRQQLETAAAHDPLTGAYNRRGMNAELEIAIEACARTDTPLGLAVLDLDHFKHINDNFGHDAGDAVLVRFAELMRQSTRKGDRFFRLGGEEFALLLPGADAASLRGITEHLRAAVENEVRCGEHGVTISIGATPLARGESASAWLSRADAAMYRAKREGRNRVVVEEVERAPPAPTLLRYQPARDLKIPGC